MRKTTFTLGLPRLVDVSHGTHRYHVEVRRRERGPANVVAGDPGTSLAEVRFGIDKAAIGKAMHDLVAELYAICRSITGDGVRDALAHREARPDHRPRSADRHPRLRLGDPPGMEHPRRVGERRAWPSRHRLSRAQPACDELQRARADPPHPRRARAAGVHVAGSPAMDPVPDVVLRTELGLLRPPRHPRFASRRRLRGVHRLDARSGLVDLRGGTARGSDRGRGVALDPHLSPLVGERQPLGHCAGCTRSGASPAGAASVPVPDPVHTGDDWVDCVAGAQRGQC